MEFKKRRAEIFEWLEAVLSMRGPKEPMNRLVLIALWKFANENLYAFPTEAQIAVRAGVTAKTVAKHLRTSEKDGWVQRQLRRSPGRSWNHYEYKLTLPQCVPDTAVEDLVQKIAA